MKRIYLIFILALQCGFCCAQFQGQYRAQYGHEFATSSVPFGVNFVGEYFPVNKFSFAPSFTIYLPATGKASQIDFSGRFYFTEEKLQAYGLMGYGFHRRRLEFDFENPLRTSSGVHFGGGALLRFWEVLGLNGEFKIQPTLQSTLVFKVGITYFIN